MKFLERFAPRPSRLRFTISATTLALLTLVAPASADPKTTHTGVLKSARIELRYRPESWAAATAERSLAAAERDLDRIAKALDVKVTGPFTLYVYDDVSEISAVTGTNGNGGFSTGTESHVPYANDQTRLHELVHVVAAKLPTTVDEPRSLFFAEGLANALLEFVDGVHVHSTAAFYLKRGKLSPLVEMTTGDFYAWLRAHSGVNAYDVAASWMRFLWDRFGVEKLKRYYGGATAKAAFGEDVAALEKSWREMLAKFPMRPETETLLRYRHGEAVGFDPYVKGLPRDLAGKPADWTTVLAEKLDLTDLAKWNREDAGVVGTNPAPEWTICEFKSRPLVGDCAVRATIKTSGYCALSVQIGRENRALYVGPGTFLFRGDNGVAQSTLCTMSAAKTDTDFVLVRRGEELEVWIDGVKALTGKAVPGPALAGVGVAQGAATFTDVRVRQL